MTFPASFTRVATAALVLSTLALAACSTDRGPRGGRGDTPRVALPLAGTETFFDDQLVVAITVGREGLPALNSDRAAGGGENARGSGGGRRRPPGGGAMGGGGMGPPPGGRSDDGSGPRPGAAMAGARGPIQLINLRFTNQSAAPLEISISDFTSLLGNFAVRPETLTLAPGATAAPEAMATQLGGHYAEVDAVLVLRLNGKTERKTIRLTNPPPPTAAPAATK